MIEILKASAGSGKTYTLAQKYIRLLLEDTDRYAYRHVLAVTFTNKATDEMKSRILKELHVLATDTDSSPYVEDFVPDCCPDIATLRQKASVVLCNILHDYGSFAVSTIDKFFQQTLRAFSREIGQFASYQVELDRNSLIEESVDRVLDSLTPADVKRLKWFTDKTLSMLADGGKYKLEGPLVNVAKRLMSEEHRALMEKYGLDTEEIYSEDALNALSEGCQKVMDEYVRALKDAIAAVEAAFGAAGLSLSDLSRDFLNQCFAKYLKLNKGGGVIPRPTDKCMEKIDPSFDKKEWFRKADKDKASLVSIGIENALSAFAALFDKEYKVYNTALLLQKQVYGFGIAGDLYREFNALVKEKNVMCLDDSNTLLKNLIDGTDAPFIYEKLGVRYEHFLLDEFQDTSRVQWDNFRPLLLNAIANGFYSLVVGDVKQSIYRFRNSDWKLLRDEVKEAFGSEVEEDTLGKNWRSMSNIVKFNGSFFNDVAERLDQRYDEGRSKEIASIYKDVEQAVAKKGDGEIIFTFCDKELEASRVLSAVQDALEKGFSYGDIAILTRTKEEGTLVATELISNKIKVVTDESLKVSSALTVRRLVSLLSSIDNPFDTMAGFLSEHLSIQVPDSYDSLTGLCEELLRGLREYDRETFEAEILYVQSFMDIVQDFVSSSGNSLHAFLKSWEGNSQSISSPSSGDAVRIMTIHKSKGLDFRYVIVPYIEKIVLYSSDERWCRPDVGGTALEPVAHGVYDVTLSNKSCDTLFEPHYREEMLMQFVDNINVAYVAFTRAVEVMHLIAAMPKEGKDIADFSGLLHDYVRSDSAAGLGVVKVDSETDEVYRIGEEHFAAEKAETPAESRNLETVFHSWPMCGRLTFTSDAYDFFAEDGSVGASASNRVKGLVLHDILSTVSSPGDVDKALAKAAVDGVLGKEEINEVAELLRERIAQAVSWGWFPDDGDGVLNETTLIDTDGGLYRPDRVVVKDGKVIVIDYKFGEHNPEYERQLRKYADIWGRMGYDDVSAYLWYVYVGEVRRVI